MADALSTVSGICARLAAHWTMESNHKPNRVRRLLSLILKLAVCGGALAYLSDKVALNDSVRLSENPSHRLRLLAEEGDTLRVFDPSNNTTRSVLRSELASAEQLRKGQRSIEYGLKTIAARADWRWASWAFIAYGPVVFILAWRLQCLLAMQDITVSFRNSLLLTLAGNFFNFSMPGTTGGDLYKAYHVARMTDRRTEGITVILLDRVMGLVSFLLIAAVTILAFWRTDMIGFYGRWVGYLTVGFFVACGLFFSRRMRRLIGYESLLKRLPLADKLKRVDETAFRFRYHPRQATSSLVSTIVSHFLIITSIYFTALALGIHASAYHTDINLYWAILLASVVGFLLAAIPISIQGFGLMEAVFFKVLVEGGWSTSSQMLALTLGLRLVQIIWSLPGVVVPWLGFARPRQGVDASNPPISAGSAI